MNSHPPLPGSAQKKRHILLYPAPTPPIVKIYRVLRPLPYCIALKKYKCAVYMNISMHQLVPRQSGYFLVIYYYKHHIPGQNHLMNTGKGTIIVKEPWVVHATLVIFSSTPATLHHASMRYCTGILSFLDPGV